MQRAIFILLGVGFLGAWLIAHRAPAPPTAGGTVTWRTDAAKAIDPATSSSRKSVVVFTANWCGPCRQMKESTWVDPKVQHELSRYNAVWADVDTSGDLAQQFGVQGIPTVVILDQDKREITRTTGFVSASDMVSLLRD
jgi:thiol:disulfide interchange protein